LGGQHFVAEGNDGVVSHQAFAVICECRGYPRRVVHGQADEPAKQRVVLGPLHQHALGTGAVEDLLKHGA